METFVQVLSTFGFPIACCIACFWAIWKLIQSHKEEIEKLNQDHKEESIKFAEALNQNTLVLQKVNDKLDRIERITYQEGEQK